MPASCSSTVQVVVAHKDAAVIAVESEWNAVAAQQLTQQREIAEGSFGRKELGGEAGAAALEPVVRRAVELDQRCLRSAREGEGGDRIMELNIYCKAASQNANWLISYVLFSLTEQTGGHCTATASSCILFCFYLNLGRLRRRTVRNRSRDCDAAREPERRSGPGCDLFGDDVGNADRPLSLFMAERIDSHYGSEFLDLHHTTSFYLR